MKLFHGSPTSNIKVFKIQTPRRGLDLGKGVYLTTRFEQAEEWALNNGNLQGSVYEFEVNPETLVCLNYESDDDELLEVLCLCRTKLTMVADEVIEGFEEADVIASPMLDGSVPGFMAFANKFIKGDISFVELSKKMKLFDNPADQLCFKSEKAVRALNKGFIQEHKVYK